MTLRLILIRHAKSSWYDPSVADHARVLNERGRTSAPVIGAWLAANAYIPDVILCSDAARTQETAALIVPHLTPEPVLQILPQLYHASPDGILGLIRKQIAPCVAVIGHNPGIALLASGLVRRRHPHPGFSDYPTCATSVISFEAVQWREVEPRTGVCTDFTVPRDLIGPETTQ